MAAAPARLALSSALLLGAAGAWLPWLALLLQARGWDGRALGLLLAVGSVVGTLAGPAWGAVADRPGAGERLLPGLILGAAGGVLLVLAGLGPAPTAVGVLVVAACRIPANGLLDVGILRSLRLAGRPPGAYGPIRTWGAAAYLAVGAMAGWVASWRVDGVAAVAAALLVLAAVTLPRFGLVEGVARAPVSGGRWPWLLLGGAALQGTSLSVSDSFFAVLVTERGGPTTYAGLGLVVAGVAEVVVMARAPGWLASVGVARALLLSGVASAARLLLTLAPWPGVVIAAQLLHGLAAGAWWVAAVAAVQEEVGVARRATGQQLLLAAAYGVGPAIAGGLAAVLLDRVGAGGLFVGGAVAAGFGVVVTAAALRGRVPS